MASERENSKVPEEVFTSIGGKIAAIDT